MLKISPHNLSGGPLLPQALWRNHLNKFYLKRLMGDKTGPGLLPKQKALWKGHHAIIIMRRRRRHQDRKIRKSRPCYSPAVLLLKAMAV